LSLEHVSEKQLLQTSFKISWKKVCWKKKLREKIHNMEKALETETFCFIEKIDGKFHGKTFNVL
jgi:hypothetical protein